MCIGASRLPPHASTPRSQFPAIDYFEMVADTVPLAERGESEREANALTACGSVVGFGQMSKGED